MSRETYTRIHTAQIPKHIYTRAHAHTHSLSDAQAYKRTNNAGAPAAAAPAKGPVTQGELENVNITQLANSNWKLAGVCV